MFRVWDFEKVYVLGTSLCTLKRPKTSDFTLNITKAGFNMDSVFLCFPRGAFLPCDCFVLPYIFITYITIIISH